MQHIRRFVLVLLLGAVLPALVLSCSCVAEQHGASVNLLSADSESSEVTTSCKAAEHGERYACYTTASQIRASQDFKYGGVNSRYYLSQEEINSLENDSEVDAGEAAFRLSKYYGMVMFDREKELLWLRKAAESGHVVAQYNLGVSIINNVKFGSKDEGLYWLRKSANLGYPMAKIKLKQPLSNELIDKLSKEGSEGNAESALTLFFYYKMDVNDENLARYWFKRWQDITHKKSN